MIDLKTLSQQLKIDQYKIVDFLRSVGNPIRNDPNTQISNNLEHLIRNSLSIKKPTKENRSLNIKKNKNQNTKIKKTHSKSIFDKSKKSNLKSKIKPKSNPKSKSNIKPELSYTKAILRLEASKLSPKHISPIKISIENNKNSITSIDITKIYQDLQYKEEVKELFYDRIENSNDWENIKFGSGKIYYKTSLAKLELIESRSTPIFNYIKTLYKSYEIKFNIYLLKENVIKFKIPEKVFEYLDLVKFLNKIKHLTVINDFNIYSLNKLKITYADLMKVLNKDKSYYLNYLAQNHCSNFPVKCIYGISENSIKEQENISFIFIHASNNFYYLIWETIDIFKSTVIFKVHKKNFYFSHVYSVVYTYICKHYQRIRYSTITKNLLIEGVLEIFRLYHNYEKKQDISWQVRLGEVLI